MLLYIFGCAWDSTNMTWKIETSPIVELLGNLAPKTPPTVPSHVQHLKKKSSGCFFALLRIGSLISKDKMALALALLVVGAKTL